LNALRSTSITAQGCSSRRTFGDGGRQFAEQQPVGQSGEGIVRGVVALHQAAAALA
jgi:hypothetical protein